jgi:hypothetical protein
VRDLSPASPEIVELGWHQPNELPELQEEAAEALITLARSATGDLAGRLRLPGGGGGRPTG